MFRVSLKNEAELDHNNIPNLPCMRSSFTKHQLNIVLHMDTKTSSRKDLKKYLFDKIQDFSGYWEPCKQPK